MSTLNTWTETRRPQGRDAREIGFSCLDPPSFGRKVGRNEPCPSGSARKYKRCCGPNYRRFGTDAEIRIVRNRRSQNWRVPGSRQRPSGVRTEMLPDRLRRGSRLSPQRGVSPEKFSREQRVGRFKGGGSGHTTNVANTVTEPGRQVLRYCPDRYR